jgi:hypothetical protein
VLVDEDATGDGLRESNRVSLSHLSVWPSVAIDETYTNQPLGRTYHDVMRGYLNDYMRIPLLVGMF